MYADEEWSLLLFCTLFETAILLLLEQCRNKWKSPSYVYKVSLLTMKARFSGIDSYSASLSGVLRTQEPTNDSPMITGQTFTLDAVGMQFSWDDSILDADADGMLDDWQHEAK